MSDLLAASCSIAPTKRRRFMWAAWWTAPPTRDPFRKPDAFKGGARTREEALEEAERAAGVRLVELEPDWARAWARVLVGQPPWADKSPRGARGGSSRKAEEAAASVWALLGVTHEATLDEIKRAFKKRALETHPDHGGDAAEFRRVHRAYAEAVKRRSRPARAASGARRTR